MFASVEGCGRAAERSHQKRFDVCQFTFKLLKKHILQRRFVNLHTH